MSLRNNEQKRRYELDVENQVVWADYQRDGERVVITHVEAPPALRGTGAAGRLMAALASEARSQNVRLVPLCGYAAAWLRRHPEHSDVTAERG